MGILKIYILFLGYVLLSFKSLPSASKKGSLTPCFVLLLISHGCFSFDALQFIFIRPTFLSLKSLNDSYVYSVLDNSLVFYRLYVLIRLLKLANDLEKKKTDHTEKKVWKMQLSAVRCSKSLWGCGGAGAICQSDVNVIRPLTPFWLQRAERWHNLGPVVKRNEQIFETGENFFISYIFALQFQQ